MKKLLYILLLFGSIVQAQFSPMVGVVASQGEQVAEQYYDFDGSITSYFTTTLSVTGYSNVSYVWDGVWDDLATLTNNIGIQESSTAMYWINTHASDSFTVQLYDGSGITSMSYTWVNDFARHQFAFTYSTTLGIRVFIDGVLEASKVDLDFSSFPINRTIQMGRRQTHTTVFSGDMYRAVFYNRTLSDSEVLDLQNNGIGSISSGKVADWGLTKSSTTWTENISSANGTNVGGVVLVN